MVQNHLMQLLAITAMEPPAKFDKNGFRNEVIKVYQSLRPLTDEYIRDNVVRGQYIAGDDRIGYREEKNVHPDSRTDTYVAMCCMWTTGVGREYLFISVPASRCLPR